MDDVPTTSDCASEIQQLIELFEACPALAELGPWRLETADAED